MPKRRGKKIWKKIDTAEIEDARERETREERQGLRVDKLTDSELYVIDSAQDAGLVQTAPSKRKREKKPLRCQVIIGAAQRARPVNAGSTKAKSKGSVRPKKRSKTVQSATRAAEDALASLELWDDKIEGKPARRQPRSTGLFDAVEVDVPGCSFNPDPEQHQDAVAAAVAVEMTKQYADEMIPEPLKVPRLPQPDELDLLLVNDDGSDEGEDVATAGPSAPPIRRKQPQKKTRTDHNRDKRRRAAESHLKAKGKLKKQRRDLDALPRLQAAVQAEEAAQAARAARRAADREEARQGGPPRLGRHRFEPPAMQVLLSEEISGSLRRLKGSAVLAGERFKSLQKRGIIAPHAGTVARKRRRRPVSFAPGLSREKLEASHEETKRILREGAKARAAAVLVEARPARDRK